jgi:hypothetical protein
MLMLGVGGEVLAPAELRDRVAAVHREMSRRYGRPAD